MDGRREREGEGKGEGEKKGGTKRETTLQLLISMHHLDPRTGFSDRFSFRGLHGGSLSGCYLQPPRLPRVLATGCPTSIVPLFLHRYFSVIFVILPFEVRSRINPRLRRVLGIGSLTSSVPVFLHRYFLVIFAIRCSS